MAPEKLQRTPGRRNSCQLLYALGIRGMTLWAAGHTMTATTAPKCTKVHQGNLDDDEKTTNLELVQDTQKGHRELPIVFDCFITKLGGAFKVSP